MTTSDLSARYNKVIRAVEAVASELPEAERPLFAEFCAAVTRQLRARYVARHGAAGVPVALLPMFRLFRQRSGDEVLVQVRPRGEGGVVIHTCMPDQPFIVDSVRLALQSFGAAYEGGFNAVVSGVRTPEGLAVSVGTTGRGLESVIQFEAGKIDPALALELEQQLLQSLRLAQSMVRDFSDMTQAVDLVASRFRRMAGRFPERGETFRETSEFLSWLLSDNYIFMGVQTEDEKLGFYRQGLPAEMKSACERSWEESPWAELPVQVRKGMVESPVHRHGQLDEVLVSVPGVDGKTFTHLRLLGMFTYRAVSQTSRSVPVLRQVLATILKDEGSRPGSWRYKGVANVFDSLPTEYLFTATVNEITQMVERVLDAEAEQQVRVHLVRKPGLPVNFAVAAMPRPQYSDRIRRRMEAVLKRTTHATYADHGVFVGRFETVLVYFYLTGATTLEDGDYEGLCSALEDLATPWEVRVYEALVQEHGDEEADLLVGRYGRSFSEEYVSRVSTRQTLRDLHFLEMLNEQRPVIADMYVDERDRLALRIYQAGNIILSDILPVLDNFGLIVNDQHSHSVSPRHGEVRHIDTFRLRGVWGMDREGLLAAKQLLLEGIEAVFSKQMVDDQLNRLLVRSGLAWKDVDLIRAYFGYARQLGLTLPQARVQEIGLDQAELVRNIVRCFHARFDPDIRANVRDAQVAAADEVVETGLRSVQNHDEDMVLRFVFGLIRASLRTNFYRTDLEGHYISFKVEHARIQTMPEPRMMYEIYVHHPEMEGTHLRGGTVARGGIRWSDRGDYRTEVLGLVATQMVKNVLIVPEGAKGGFLLRHVIRDRARRRAQADALYKFFIRGLLDVTDNIVDGEVVRPPRVVARDGDDPYLVVAADKGTAHLSDTANSVAVEEYNFWLGDAFASGGSCGYDHKAVGITARGAWECVDRHFAEMRLDPRTETFTCAGVGDCGGDVFGNGVVRYRNMKLQAAFNHLHVFLDPDPDVDTAFKERKRLFRAVKGWDHYNPKIISEGGGVFERTAKSIKLSPEVRQMLGTLKEELSPDEVINLILRMPVDLLWNGGIGTYVKASHETHLHAGDPTNDHLRVDAKQLRCKAVGEGGNLGFTQKGRIEFALGGGRISTDAVDNSGGVDMSDHEVNLKILLAPLVNSGALTGPERNTLIEELTGEVAKAVLANNDAHARQLSIDQLRSKRDPMAYSRAVQWVCRRAGASPKVLALPSDDALRRRTLAGKGLTRPELATLAAHVKMHVYKDLQSAKTEWIPGFDERLLSYFPARVREEYPEVIAKHMLAKPICMTVVLTQVVADAGASFFPTLMDLTGRHPGEIAGAYLLVSGSVGLDQIRKQLNRDQSGLSGRYLAWERLTEGLAGVVAAWLAPGERPPTQEELVRINELLVPVARYSSRAANESAAAAVTSLVGQGVPRSVAKRSVGLQSLTMAREVALLQAQTGDKDRDAVVRFMAVGEASNLLPAIRKLERRKAEGKWDPVALGILRTRYFQLLRALLRKVELGSALRLGTGRLTPKLRAESLSEVASDLDTILGPSPDVGAFLVAEERVRAMVLG